MTDAVSRIRKTIVQQRSSLSRINQQQASKIIAQRLLRSLIFLNAERIAFYFPTRGEIDTVLVIKRALSQSKECYFPILHPLKHNRLWFGRYHQNDPLIKNHYGILEPDLKFAEQVKPWSLDLVITPLVAFDKKGNRLGMGKGYYDRTFAFKNDHLRSKPFLLGLAYDFQEVPDLHAHHWDVPLNAVLTEHQFLQFGI